MRLYEAGQALNLITHYTHRICQSVHTLSSCLEQILSLSVTRSFSDIWTLSGETVRLAVALGLNHLTKPSVCLAPPVDAAEEQDRRNNFWWSATGNSFASANTGWATSLQPGEQLSVVASVAAADRLTGLRGHYYTPSVTHISYSGAYPAHLSVRLHPDFIEKPKDREREWRALSHWSPEFYHFHPPQHVGGTQLLFKVMLLLGRSVMQPARTSIVLAPWPEADPREGCPTFGHPVSAPKHEVTPQDVRNE